MVESAKVSLHNQPPEAGVAGQETEVVLETEEGLEVELLTDYDYPEEELVSGSGGLEVIGVESLVSGSESLLVTAFKTKTQSESETLLEPESTEIDFKSRDSESESQETGSELSETGANGHRPGFTEIYERMAKLLHNEFTTIDSYDSELNSAISEAITGISDHSISEDSPLPNSASLKQPSESWRKYFWTAVYISLLVLVAACFIILGWAC